MDNIETCHNKNVVAAETVGSRIEADLFKSVLIIGAVNYIKMFHHQKMIAAEIVGFRFEARQMSSDDHRILLSWTTLCFPP